MTFDISKPFTCRNGAEAGATKGPDGRLYGWAVTLNQDAFISLMVWDAKGPKTYGL